MKTFWISLRYSRTTAQPFQSNALKRINTNNVIMTYGIIREILEQARNKLAIYNKDLNPGRYLYTQYVS